MKSKPFLLIISIFLMLNIASCSSTPGKESTGEFFDSSLITAKVKARLIDDRVTAGFSIKVSTYKGTVYLSGDVSSERAKKHANTIAKGVSGVKGIENDLVVRASK